MPLPDEIPAEPGAYALLLRLAEPRRITVGRLGEFLFQPGEYIYLGSACGPGGLRGRLGRHLGPPPVHPHWHIDYLRQVAEVSTVYWASCASHLTPLECLWSQALATLPGAYIPAPSFGGGDCTAGCAAHLIALSPSSLPPSLSTNEIQTLLTKALEHNQLQGANLVANWVGKGDERHMTRKANSATINTV
jgi:Uri superfamily endonuclease